MINSINCVFISTTIYDNIVSEKRRENLKFNSIKHGINMYLLKGEKLKFWTDDDLNKKSKKIQMETALNSYKITLKMLLKFKELNCKYGIICQDDFYPIDNFWVELNKTVEKLPSNWEILHLCPFWAWGKEYRDPNKIGKYNPCKYVDDSDLACDDSDRFFKNCESSKYFKKKLWLGGPLAFLIKKESLDNILMRYKPNNNNFLLADDVMMTYILNKNSYICKNPQLGYEEECGGSTYLFN